MSRRIRMSAHTPRHPHRDGDRRRALVRAAGAPSTIPSRIHPHPHPPLSPVSAAAPTAAQAHPHHRCGPRNGGLGPRTGPCVPAACGALHQPPLVALLTPHTFIPKCHIIYPTRSRLPGPQPRPQPRAQHARALCSALPAGAPALQGFIQGRPPRCAQRGRRSRCLAHHRHQRGARRLRASAPPPGTLPNYDNLTFTYI